MIKMNYGILAINKEGEILHFCGYETEPSYQDWIHLQDELNTDLELGMVGVEHVLVPASPEMCREYQKMIDGTL